MTKLSFSDFYKSLIELVKTFEEKDTILKVEEDLALNIIRIFGEGICLLYTSPSPRDGLLSRMPSSA